MAQLPYNPVPTETPNTGASPYFSASADPMLLALAWQKLWAGWGNLLIKLVRKLRKHTINLLKRVLMIGMQMSICLN